MQVMFMKVLLHACCAPCAHVFTTNFSGGFFDFFWYNHNIHPFTEYQKRRDALAAYAFDNDINLVANDEYGLRGFVAAAMPNLDGRCEGCYRTRLTLAAKMAKNGGYDAFSTSLLVSPYQKFDLICEIGAEIAAHHGLIFIKEDFRQNYREGLRQARQMGIYTQKYCGCIFSEEERYLSHKPS